MTKMLNSLQFYTTSAILLFSVIREVFSIETAKDIWTRVLEIVSTKISSVAIDTWLNDIEAIEFTDNRLVLHCPSELKRDVLKTRFLSALEEALFTLFAGEIELLILNTDELESFIKGRRAEKALSDNLSPKDMTFSRFVVGASNKFAHAAAKAVSENPLSDYNPLFIYGNSGLGKTHLLHAIEHTARNRRPDTNIVYVTGEGFTNDLIDAIQAGKNREFRSKYRTAQYLLIDDIQFIAGRVQTQEEFFHTFNTLYELNCQIILTSDRPPMEIARLDDRLKTRFEWGLLADINPPDYETRMAIVKKKMAQYGLNLPHSVLHYIAENITANIRQLEGAVRKLIAYHQLLDDQINDFSAVRAVKDILQEKSEHMPTPNVIISETARFFSIKPEDIKGKSKTKTTVYARQISAFLIRKYTNFSLADIGREYSGKSGHGLDHSTILNSISKIETQLESDSDLKDILRDISNNIETAVEGG